MQSVSLSAGLLFDFYGMGSLRTSNFFVNLCKCLRKTLLLSSLELVLCWEIFFYFSVCFVHPEVFY